jgi:hypothetical protein
MTRVCNELACDELALGLDEHAPSPTASMPAAPTAKSFLWLSCLLIIASFLSFERSNVTLVAVVAS